MTHLLATNQERLERHTQNTTRILQFLQQEIYTDLKTLMLLLNYKQRRPLDRLLKKLMALEYITKHVFEFQTGKIALWGISEIGLTQEIQDFNGDLKAFEPHQVKFNTINHRLMNQHARIYLERQGWTQWQNGDRYSFKERYPVAHRPDAVIKTPKGHSIALETERTLKTVHRYRSIFKSHILAKQKRYWDAVFYVVSDDKMRQLLSKRFDRIEYIAFDESRHNFDSYRSKMIRIVTLEELHELGNL